MFLCTRSSFKGDARGGGGEKEKKGRKKKGQEPANALNFRKFQLLTTTERKHLLMTPLPLLPVSYRI
jgi:hypothetical protein